MRTLNDIENLVAQDLVTMNRQLPPAEAVFLEIKKGKSSEFPKKRDYAYTVLKNNGNLIIVYAPKMLREPLHRVRGVMRHELGHALLMSRNDLQHSERLADVVAERFFGTRIYYDEDDIQTTNLGQYPRPAHLPK